MDGLYFNSSIPAIIIHLPLLTEKKRPSHHNSSAQLAQKVEIKLTTLTGTVKIKIVTQFLANCYKVFVLL
jgi:hypothetical protein